MSRRLDGSDGNYLRGSSDCPECRGSGRVRRTPLKKDGTPKKVSRWERCECVPHKVPGNRGTSVAVTLYPTRLMEVPVYPPGFQRPQYRSECQGGPRPCPLVGCRYNTYLDVLRDGTIRLNHGNVAPELVPPEKSCALDIADAAAHDLKARQANAIENGRRRDRGGARLDQIAEILGCTRENVRLIEKQALEKLQKKLPEGHPLQELLTERLTTLAQHETCWDTWDKW